MTWKGVKKIYIYNNNWGELVQIPFTNVKDVAIYAYVIYCASCTLYIVFTVS